MTHADSPDIARNRLGRGAGLRWWTAAAGRCAGPPCVRGWPYVGFMEITVVEGDITAQDIDAVVNAANRAMRGGGGVDGAIHAAGGRAVLEDCRKRFPAGLATGDAGWTTAGLMPARWVIHVVGPNYNRGERDRSLLTSCYERALAVADDLGARTVAFPLISAGSYGWPKSDAIDAAMEVLRAAETQLFEARMVAFGSSSYTAIQEAIRRG